MKETAALVDEAGGRGIAVQVDHLIPAEVRALVTRIEAEQGDLHVLVNDIWGATTMGWNKSVWESGPAMGDGAANPSRVVRFGLSQQSAIVRLLDPRWCALIEWSDPRWRSG